MKNILLFCLLLGTSQLSSAITKIDGTIKVTDNHTAVVFLKEILPVSENRKPLEQELNIGDKRTFSMKLDVKKAGFFNLTVVTDNQKKKSAYSSVIYLTPDAKLDIEYLGNDRFGLVCNYDKIKSEDNKALFEIHELYNAQLMVLFGGKPDPAVQREELKTFFVIADKILARKGLSAEVKKYLKFNAFDTYNTNLYRLALDYNRGSKTNVPVGAGFFAQPMDPLFYFNNPMILLFPNGISNVIRYLEVHTDSPVYKNRKSLGEINKQIELLISKVSERVLVDRVIESMLSSYVTAYRVSTQFDQDLQAYAITAHQIQDLAVRAKVKKQFENLRYTMKGASLPSLTFEDSEGNLVSLDQFKGKYLFIDLWASWCVPCIKMTPYVQELEKQYEGKNITFVAISIDGNKQSWLSKMKELNMHGNQFLDLPGAFTKSLNVSGIPHYLIYSPEGKLVVYKADMPNDPKLKATIDQLPGL